MSLADRDEFEWDFPPLADPDEIEEIITELGDIIIVSSDLQKKLQSQAQEIIKLREEIAQLRQIIAKSTSQKKHWFW